MDPVFDAQYLRLKDSFRGTETEIAIDHTDDGQPSYVYVADQILTRQADLDELREALPRLARDYTRVERVYGELRQVSIGGEGHHDDDGHLTVPEALDLIERRVGRERMYAEDEPLATAAHIVHKAKLCSAPEPEVRAGPAPAPYPPPAAPGAGQNNITLGISDTGLWQQPPANLHPWLAGVVGGGDPPGPALG